MTVRLLGIVGFGPPGAAYYYSYRALRAAAYDLPEDFIARLEPGIDDATKIRLAKGVRVLGLLRRFDRIGLASALVGAIMFPASVVLLAATGDGAFIPIVFAMIVVPFVLATILVALAGSISLFHRRELHEVMAFYRAMQGSSLARDIG